METSQYMCIKIMYTIVLYYTKPQKYVYTKEICKYILKKQWKKFENKTNYQWHYTFPFTKYTEAEFDTHLSKLP